MTIKNRMVTREQYDDLKAKSEQADADVEMLGQSYAELGAWRRGQVNALTRALKIRNRWVAALAITLIAQTVAIIWAMV